MPAKKPIDALRDEARKLLVERLEKITVTQAAAELAVSRQAIYDVRNGKSCPSLALIQKACEVWNIEFNFRGINVSTKTLKPKGRGVVRRPEQLTLIDTWNQLENHQFIVVSATRKGQAVELTLRLELTA